MNSRYQVGDCVEIVDTPTEHYWCKARNRWLGQVMTIREVVSPEIYFMEEDRGALPWNRGMIKEKVI